jgi:acetyl-CoA decarbonylase/synthase, CODH/ACS complex subunit gamma
MAKLTGIGIYKLLPKTNCGECKFPTCMAFAMQVAAKKVALEACPYVSEAAKQELADSAAPPMRVVTIGAGPGAVAIGGETVLFRHEEKFHRATGVAIRVSDQGDVAAEVDAIGRLKFVRSGKPVHVEMIALEQKGDPKSFRAAAEVIKARTELAVILMSTDAAALAGALEVLADRKPLLYGATTANLDAVAKLAKDRNVPLAVKGGSLDELADLTAKARQAGVEDLVLAPELGSAGHGLSLLTQLRRLALEKNFRPLGYPVLALTSSEDPVQESLQATTYVCKYASIVVMRGREAWQVLPVLTARYNLYTDPQVPNAVDVKLVKLREPGPDSPVIVTTNFALTYFTVEGEVENSKTPTYIVVVDTNGLGILNSYADNKLTGETIAKAVKATGVMDMVKHKRVVIPGLVSVLKGELEDELGCEVVVGPEEAAGIPAFLKTQWRSMASA